MRSSAPSFFRSRKRAILAFLLFITLFPSLHNSKSFLIFGAYIQLQIIFWLNCPFSKKISMILSSIRSESAAVILGDSKRQIVKKFGQAALTYTDNPVAVHLRAMNMLYKGLRKIPQSSSFQVRLLSRCHWGLTAVTMGIQVLRNYEKRFLTYSDTFPVSAPAKGELK